MKSDVEELKESDLVKLGPCPRCGKKLFEDQGQHGGMVAFYVVSVSSALTSPHAIRRRVGLAMQLGSDALAKVMGPDEGLAAVLPPTRFILHQMCAFEKMDGLMECVEVMSDRAKEAEPAEPPPCA